MTHLKRLAPKRGTLDDGEWQEEYDFVIHWTISTQIATDVDIYGSDLGALANVSFKEDPYNKSCQTCASCYSITAFCQAASGFVLRVRYWYYCFVCTHPPSPGNKENKNISLFPNCSEIARIALRIKLMDCKSTTIDICLDRCCHHHHHHRRYWASLRSHSGKPTIRDHMGFMLLAPYLYYLPPAIATPHQSQAVIVGFNPSQHNLTQLAKFNQLDHHSSVRSLLCKLLFKFF